MPGAKTEQLYDLTKLLQTVLVWFIQSCHANMLFFYIYKKMQVAKIGLQLYIRIFSQSNIITIEMIYLLI